MDYSSYKESRDMTWKELINNNINSLPIKINTICKNRGISLISYSKGADLIRYINNGEKYVSNDGFSIGNKIFYNEKCSAERTRFTIAHELGHIMLGHTQSPALINREISPDDSPLETAANVFASRLLAPACVLWGIGVTDYHQIQALCSISETAARFRMERIDQLYEREQEFLKRYDKSCFLISPLERQVYEMFAEYIAAHKL